MARLRFPIRQAPASSPILLLSQPATLHAALCSSGRRLSVRYERRQAERKDQNGRQIPGNFDKLAGDVFDVVQGKVGMDESCFLASDSLLSSATLLPAKPAAGSGECDSDIRRRIASSRTRSVVNCWPIASLPAARQLVLVEFARQDKDALANIVLIDRDRPIFADYPAVFRGEGKDLWRVDDGGVLSANGLQVVFVLQRGTAYTLGVSWSGAEGASLAVFASDGGDRFTRVLADYWYRSPL